MSLVPIDLRPDTTKLRRFALAWFAFVGLAWPLLLVLRGHPRAAMIVAVAGVLGAAAGWSRPGLLRPAWIVLTVAGWPIGWVVANIALAILFFGVILPIGLLAKLFRRDPLHLRSWRTDASAWRAREKSDLPRYLRQY